MSKSSKSTKTEVEIEVAEIMDMMTRCRDELKAWSIPSGADIAEESHRLADYMEALSKQAGRLMHRYEPLREQMTKKSIPWEGESLVIELRWAAQEGACALMAAAIDQVKAIETKGMKGGWQTRQVLKPLGHCVMGAMKVHQFAGGFNHKAWQLAEDVNERTLHYARLTDPKWVGHSKVVT